MGIASDVARMPRHAMECMMNTLHLHERAAGHKAELPHADREQPLHDHEAAPFTSVERLIDKQPCSMTSMFIEPEISSGSADSSFAQLQAEIARGREVPARGCHEMSSRRIVKLRLLLGRT